MKKKTIYTTVLVGLSLSACNDFLDREPLDEITPEVYFTTAEQLGAYAIGRYQDNFEAALQDAGYSYGIMCIDNNTDVQVTAEGDQERWVPGIWRVDDGDGDWEFEEIYKMNYFLDNVLPKWHAGEISGSISDIEHYIGEIYMMRANAYFRKLKTFGDFPIIRNTIDISDKQAMIEANRRYPMNEVGRFIISDLDSAAILMSSPASDDSKRNRLTRNAALLLKSRVALYVGSWLQNFKGTAFVPGGNGWPGASMSYNSGFSLDVDSEVDYFLGEAMSAAKEIADNVTLTRNTQTAYETSSNPYVLMFSDHDLSTYDEVLFWRETSTLSGAVGYGFVHSQGGGGTGYTRAYVNSFLCSDGLPIYVSPLYMGDDNLKNVRANRDNRLVQFMKIDGDVMSVLGDGSYAYFPYPVILTTAEYKSTTGYDLKKGLTMSVDDKTGPVQETGVIEYRAVEAYLNYIEACYLRNGSLDGSAKSYWRAIRERAGVDPDFEKTIQVTDMSQESSLLSAYTAGKLVDPTLYNIRRERACEMMSEGLRWDDLRRWRSMDQLIGSHYQVEGFKLWGEIQNWYKNTDGSSQLLYIGGGSSKDYNVSSPMLSDYIRPYQIIQTNNNLYEGYSWTAANYLSPIGMSQFNITSGDNLDYSTSPLYQNPGWPTMAGGTAENVEGF